jgi:hypothetical protein
MALRTDLKEVAAEISKHFTETVQVREGPEKDGKPTLIVQRASMYEAPEYIGEGGLIGMWTMLRDTCGGTDIEEWGEIREEGCETCDWGSLYGIEYRVW